MSQVEITNVGGTRPRDGVASEATLRELVRTLNKSGQNNLAQQVQQRYQKNFTKTLTDTTKSIGKLGSAVTGLAGEFLSGGDRLGDFTEHLLKTNGVLQRLIRFGDSLVDQFRELSSVGASFNNSIFDMRLSALQSAMSLDSFQEMVINNSSTLRLFGDGVSDGVRNFSRLSRQFRDLNPQFFNMGFSIEEINEGLINYAELLANTGRAEQINSRNMVSGSAEYLRQLDLLAKVTGQNREALARQAVDINNDARMRALLARAQGDQADNVSKNAAALMALAPGLRDSYLNLSTFGVATDEMSRRLEMTGGAAAELADLFRNSGEYTQDEFLDELARIGPAAMRLVNERFGPEIMSLVPEFASLSDALVSLGAVTNADIEALRLEQSQRERITETFAGFSDTIHQLRAFIVEQIIESEAFSALGELGNTIKGLLTPGEDGSLPEFQGTLNRVINSLVGEEGIITRAIGWINNLIQTNDFKTRIEGFVDTLLTVTNRIVDYFLGSLDNSGNRSGGFFAKMTETIESWFGDQADGKTVLQRIGDSIVEGWQNFWQGETGTQLINTISNWFRSLINLMEDTFVNSFLARNILGIDRNEVALRNLEVEGDVSQRQAENFGRAFFEQLQQRGSRAGSGVVGSALTRNELDQILENLGPDMASAFLSQIENNRSFLDHFRPRGLEAGIEISELAKLASLGEASQEQMNLLRELYRSGVDLGIFDSMETRRIGTLQATGMRSEPKDTVAQIHAGERVLNPQETREYNRGQNQSALIEKVDQLNKTMSEVVSILRQDLDVQRKTMRKINGLGPDLMKGLPNQ